jgi:hypothetical protein
LTIAEPLATIVQTGAPAESEVARSSPQGIELAVDDLGRTAFHLCREPRLATVWSVDHVAAEEENIAWVQGCVKFYGSILKSLLKG